MQNLVPRDCSKHTYSHTHTVTHTTHIGTCTHKHSDYTKLNLHSFKWANGDLRWMKIAAWKKNNMAGLHFWEKKCV